MKKLRLHLLMFFFLMASIVLPAQEDTSGIVTQDSLSISTDNQLALSLSGTTMVPVGDSLIHSGIVNAIAAANASQLSQFFDVAISLSIPDSEGTFSKKQATQLLKFFFDRNPVKEFVVEIEDKTDEDSSYLIGYYHTTEGKTYRTFVLIKKLTENELIRQIQLEEK